MARQLFIVVLLLLGLGAIHAAGTHRPVGPADFEDPYAWLGPIPADLKYDDIRQRWGRLINGMIKDVPRDDVRQFVCRSPAEVGPVPLMRNVVRYMDGFPQSRDDHALAGGLAKAAAQGNWLARKLLLSQLIDPADYPASEADDLVRLYRAVTLAEWLRWHRLGHLYSELANLGFRADGHESARDEDPSGLLAAAAMRHDFVAQARVGGMLTASDEPDLVSAGGRMLTCAAAARAFYRTVAAKNGSGAFAQAPGRTAREGSVRP